MKARLQREGTESNYIRESRTLFDEPCISSVQFSPLIDWVVGGGGGGA